MKRFVFCFLAGLLCLAAQGFVLGQVEQSVQYAQHCRHVLVLQSVLALQVVAGKILATEAAVGGVLALPRRVYGGNGLLEHCIVGREALQTVVDLLCHAVVVSVRQARQIVGCKCFLCHNLIFLKG